MSRYRLAFTIGFVGLLVVSFLVGNMSAPAVVAQDDAPQGSGAPTMQGGELLATFKCTPDSVAIYDDRMHVHCSSAASGDITYFAYATTSANCSRYLAIANTAYALGDDLWIHYYSSADSNPSGCQTGDCRGMYGLSMVP